jgi:hypothetical protein
MAARTIAPRRCISGTVNVTEAQRITLAAGQELGRRGAGVTTDAPRVSRTVPASTASLTPGMLMVVQTNVGFGMSMSGSTQMRPDGTFTVTGLAPGKHAARTADGWAWRGTRDRDGNRDHHRRRIISNLTLVAAKRQPVGRVVVVRPPSAPPLLMIGVFPRANRHPGAAAAPARGRGLHVRDQGAAGPGR